MTEHERPAAGRAQGRVGLRRRGHLGLARRPQHRGHRAGRPRPGHAGPGRPVGRPLAQAVDRRRGQPEVLDDKVLRLLRLARRVGAVLDDRRPLADRGPQPAGARSSSGLIDPRVWLRCCATARIARAAAQRAARRCPRPGRARQRSRVIGPNAFQPAIQGGGSAGVVPATRVHPGRGAGRGAGRAGRGHRGARLPDLGDGARARRRLAARPGDRRARPAAGVPHRRTAAVLAAEHRTSTALTWWDGSRRASAGARTGGSCCPPRSGRTPAGRTCSARPASAGSALDGRRQGGRRRRDQGARRPGRGHDPAGRGPRDGAAGGRPGGGRSRLEFSPAADGEGPLAVRLGIAPAADDDDAARRGGARRRARPTPRSWSSARPTMTESEGFDRRTLALPGRQDELVRRVAAVNPARSWWSTRACRC